MPSHALVAGLLIFVFVEAGNARRIAIDAAHFVLDLGDDELVEVSARLGNGPTREAIAFVASEDGSIVGVSSLATP